MQRTAGAAKLQMGGVLDSRSLFANPRAKLSRKVTAVPSVIRTPSAHFPVVSKPVCHLTFATITVARINRLHRTPDPQATFGDDGGLLPAQHG